MATTLKTTLEYLQDLPLYREEKPYWCFVSPREDFDPDSERLDNLEFEDHEVEIISMRDSKVPATLDRCGFEIAPHTTSFTDFETIDAINGYKAETENHLSQALGAVFVKCYDTCLRKNVTFERSQFDIIDPLLKQGPAQGVHIDITFDSGPSVITRYLTSEEMDRYLRPGFRIRIVNLIPVLEDRPLALCDGLSVAAEDLVPTDRIVPDRVGEVYFLKYNPNHRWYWLEKQTSSEPLVFVMYDTKAGAHARYCPHVSFINPKAPQDALPRESIETRSIVVTKET